MGVAQARPRRVDVPQPGHLVGTHDRIGVPQIDRQHHGHDESVWPDPTATATPTPTEQFPQLATTACPFRNLPERTKGRWRDGLTAQDLQNCRWLKPRLVAVLEFLEWTPTSHLRHPKFVALHTDRDPRGVVREQPASLDLS